MVNARSCRILTACPRYPHKPAHCGAASWPSTKTAGCRYAPSAASVRWVSTASTCVGRRLESEPTPPPAAAPGRFALVERRCASSAARPRYRSRTPHWRAGADHAGHRRRHCAWSSAFCANRDDPSAGQRARLLVPEPVRYAQELRHAARPRARSVGIGTCSPGSSTSSPTGAADPFA